MASATGVPFPANAFDAHPDHSSGAGSSCGQNPRCVSVPRGVPRNRDTFGPFQRSSPSRPADASTGGLTSERPPVINQAR